MKHLFFTVLGLALIIALNHTHPQGWELTSINIVIGICCVLAVRSVREYIVHLKDAIKQAETKQVVRGTASPPAPQADWPSHKANRQTQPANLPNLSAGTLPVCEGCGSTKDTHEVTYIYQKDSPPVTQKLCSECALALEESGAVVTATAELVKT